jgi:hypothetical protein
MNSSIIIFGGAIKLRTYANVENHEMGGACLGDYSIIMNI